MSENFTFSSYLSILFLNILPYKVKREHLNTLVPIYYLGPSFNLICFTQFNCVPDKTVKSDGFVM